MSEVCFATDLRAFCTLFAATYGLRRSGGTWDFIILNKGPTKPPRPKQAKGSHARQRTQNFSSISVPSPPPCLFVSVSVSSSVPVSVSCGRFGAPIFSNMCLKSGSPKPDYHSHQSESDWCELVVRFGRPNPTPSKHLYP